MSLQVAESLISFINDSPTPYHAVDSAKILLNADGFVELSEKSTWDLKEGKYYVTRNDSSIIAFKIADFNSGIAMIGAHTDSPGLRIKPVSSKTSEGFIQVGVEQYGGAIFHTWFDRDLSIAGRVFVSVGDKIESKLLKIDKPLLKIPSLAIHLDRNVNTKFEFDKETKLVPIAGQTHLCKDDPELQLTPEEFESIEGVIKRHNKSLVELIGKELGVEISQIEDFELILFDTQKAVIGGLNDEFIFSARQDNLTSCYTAVRGLIESETKGMQLISLFDHEEIGSVSNQGADSSFLPDVLHRILKERFHETMAKSFLVSSDVAHGVHPNYNEFYEAKHRPQFNKGPVIKINANQRYTTNSTGIVLIKKVAEIGKVPLQLFVVKNGGPCGSTIGPFLSAKFGLLSGAIDLGVTVLGMHSCRETGSSFDIAYLKDLFKLFFENYKDVSEKFV